MLRARLSMLCVSCHLLLVPVVHVCLSIALAHMLDAAGWGLRGEGLRELLTCLCGNCLREHLTWLCESFHLLYMCAQVTNCWRECAAHIVFFLSTRRCFALRCICCYTTFWPQRLGQNMRYSKAWETRNNECYTLQNDVSMSLSGLISLDECYCVLKQSKTNMYIDPEHKTYHEC